MRRVAVLALLLLTASAAVEPAAGPAAEPAAAPVPIERLAWLAGCWQAVGGEPGSGEQWTRPAGDTLLGTSRTVRGGRTVGWEFVRIERLADGRLTYVALPSNQRQATFPLREAGERAVVFENPEHDFPQRIRYELGDDGLLRARIEGELGGEPRAVELPLRRVACDPPWREPNEDRSCFRFSSRPSSTTSCSGWTEASIEGGWLGPTSRRKRRPPRSGESQSVPSLEAFRICAAEARRRPAPGRTPAFLEGLGSGKRDAGSFGRRAPAKRSLFPAMETSRFCPARAR